MTEGFIQNVQFDLFEGFIQNVQFDLFSVELVIGDTDTATLLLAENYVTIREVFVDNIKVEPNERKQIFLTGDLWELNEGDVLQPKENKTFTIKKAYEVEPETGSTSKFLNEQGDFTPINTSPIGITGSELYMSVQDSDIAGYKLLSNTIDTQETEITITASSADGIVWGNKYLTTEYTATTIPAKSWGFDYWRKVSTTLNNSSKHLRVFIYRSGVETDIITLTSPDINDIVFTERQIAYTLGAIELQQGDRIGVQEGFSTTRVQDVTLTFIIGDGRGWFMRVPLAISHKDTTDKNAEPEFQHVTQEEKTGFHTHNNKEYLDNYNPTLFATALQGEKADSALQSLPPNTVIDADYPTLKNKVNGIEENANNYQHPLQHSTKILSEVKSIAGNIDRYLNERGNFTKPTISHIDLTYKNDETTYQHIDTTTTKETLVEADKVPIYDSVTGKVVLTNKTNVGVTDIISTNATNNTGTIVIDTTPNWQRVNISIGGTLILDYPNGTLPTKNREYLLIINNESTTVITLTLPTVSFVKNGITYNFKNRAGSVPIEAGRSIEVNVVFFFIDTTTCNIRTLISQFI